MAIKVDELLQPEYDSLMQGVVDNLNNFIESIKCIKETYEYSELTLRTHLIETTGKYNNFIKSCSYKDIDGRSVIEVPVYRVRELRRLHQKKCRAERAIELVPPSYFVSLVSAYDSFFAGLVRCYYVICPEKLQESEMKFSYRELQELENIAGVTRRIVDKRVESLLRDSHVDQIEWFAKALDVNTLASFKGWKDFVEATERRNLFVHASGTVSHQYIEMCTKHSSLADGILEGNQLKVDKAYFDKAFKTFYKIAIMLSQMLLRVKYCEKAEEGCESIVDRVLIGNVFDIIVDKYYDVAIDVSEMVLFNPKFSHNAFDRMYIVLNYAQAYKWSGDQGKCREILMKEDWTAYTNELLIPKYTLEENYAEVYKRMREIGNANKHITMSSYREWPIFQRLREQDEFEAVFAEIYGENFGNITDVEIPQAVDAPENDLSSKAIEARKLVQTEGHRE